MDPSRWTEAAFMEQIAASVQDKIFPDKVQSVFHSLQSLSVPISTRIGFSAHNILLLLAAPGPGKGLSGMWHYGSTATRST
jgi:hypothetical protein